MQDRLKSIKSIAKAVKLRLPFEPSNDNIHDMVDAIILLCEEQQKPDWANDTTKMSAYLINGQWQSVGIPKRQPFHEQVSWAAHKGAEKIRVTHEGMDSEIEIAKIINS